MSIYLQRCDYFHSFEFWKLQYMLFIWGVLLLNFSANPLVLNDDCQTALEVARAKGHSNVVRAIEVTSKLL